jgi:hypothetical protein
MPSDGGFFVVRWSNARRLYLCGLFRAPVVISAQQPSILVMQLDRRVSKSVENGKEGQSPRKKQVSAGTRISRRPAPTADNAVLRES